MIKKMFVFLLISLFITGTLFAATPGSRQSPGIGDIKGQGDSPSDPHKTFRLVRWMPQTGLATGYATSVRFNTCTADSIVIWDFVSDDGVTVTTTVTSPDSAVAGIIVATIVGPLTADGTSSKTAVNSVGDANWGWLQTYGLSQVTIGSNTVAAGDSMGTSAMPGSSDTFKASTSDSRKNGNAGFFLDAAAALATDVEVFLRCE